MKCDELKVYHCNEWHNEYTEFYLKSEADKVIAQKDTKIIQLEALIENYIRISGEIIDNANHQKYKRCLAMARGCESEENRLEAIATLFDTDKECWEYNSDYLEKWCDRWLKLAEKFKEAK